MSELSPAYKFFIVVNDLIHENKRFRLGQILTIIDACISDKEQRKAIKDLIESSYWKSSEGDEIKEVFRQFFNKYVPDLVPKDKEDLMFWNDKGIERSSNQNYFPDK